VAVLKEEIGEMRDEEMATERWENEGGRIVDVEIADKMTDRQIIAKAREHSLKQSTEQIAG
jgi:hypothetical protein